MLPRRTRTPLTKTIGMSMQPIKAAYRGFTLIELMIVIAIIAILISLAVPRYASYTVRSRITEGLSLAAGAKIAVAEYIMATGTWPNNNENAGLPVEINSKYVESIEIAAQDDGGLITISYSQSAIPELASNNVLVLLGSDNNGNIDWDCANNSTTITSNYLPPECRQ